MKRLLLSLCLFACLPTLGSLQNKAQEGIAKVSPDSIAAVSDSIRRDSLSEAEATPTESILPERSEADSLTTEWDASLYLPPDSLSLEGFPRVSLLTCSPAAKVWQQYGHTALRYEDPSENIDVVFNYGLFSFATPHFIWRFCTGQTDYMLGAEEFSSFEEEYMERGSPIVVQVLNMTPAEVARFWTLITENCRPTNRVYRYNFLYKNCSTMARDIALQSIEGRLVPPADDSLTLRQILHSFNSPYPWTSFGIDLLLGYEVDRPVSNAQAEFAPELVMRHWALSKRTGFSDGLAQDSLSQDEALLPWVKGQTRIIPEKPMAEPFHFPLTPMQMMILVLLLTAIVCTLELLTEHVHWWYDLILYGVQGVAGIIIFFLFFFSAHPAVGTNMLVFLFNPIILFLLPIMIVRTIRHKSVLFFCWTELALTAAFASAVLIAHQSVPIALWIFVGALLLRTAHHLILRNYINAHMRKEKKIF